VLSRIAAVAAVCIATIVAQTPDGGVVRADAVAADSVTATPPLVPDENDPMVLRARQNLEQVKRLAAMGALPMVRLQKAQEDVQDSLDMSLLKQSLYSKDLLPEQADQMIQVAQKMVLRRQRALLQMQELVNAGVVSLAEAQATSGDVDRAKRDLEWAQERAALITQLAENVKIEKMMVSIETQVDSHPEWDGKIYTRYDGNGVFKPADRLRLEADFAAKFAKPLPISADGETALHRSMGFDHRGRVDVAVTPEQQEGAWLMKYLEQHKIPYFAFRAAVPHMATGAHIHVGPGSTRLGQAGF
jgi:hypothetical protein